MSETAKKTSARSYSQFEAQIEFRVTRNAAEVQSIELDTQLQYVTQAMSFAATAVQIGAAAGSVAFAYLNVSDFCDTIMNQITTEAELALWDYTYGEDGVSGATGGSEALSLAAAESQGSSVSAAFSGGAAPTHVKVEGEDIDLFKAAIVTGDKNSVAQVVRPSRPPFLQPSRLPLLVSSPSRKSARSGSRVTVVAHHFQIWLSSCVTQTQRRCAPMHMLLLLLRLVRSPLLMLRRPPLPCQSRS